MRAMVLDKIVTMSGAASPLRLVERPRPVPGPGEVLVRVSVCGVCHTELDEIEGRTPPPILPVVPGHQAVGRVADVGPGVSTLVPGDRVGVAWIFSSCGACDRCRRGDENLCAGFRATGRDADGGYAEYMTVSEAFAHRIPEPLTDVEAAPLLCAGAIGYRSLRLANLPAGGLLGLTGFGASAHLVLRMVRHTDPAARVLVFARSAEERAFALEIGASWAGDTEETAPEPLDAIIDTTPAWRPIVEALRSLRPGGRLVVNAIRKESSDRDALLDIRYETHLWHEKEVKSVANVTRRDVRELLDLAASAGLRPDVQTYTLEEANAALRDLNERRIRGAKVLAISA